MTELPLTRKERLRRTALVCAHFTRNLAYYRAGRNGDELRVPPDTDALLYVTINSNFLDIAVLEWLKLFFATQQHAWQNVVRDPAQFQAGLLAHLGCTEDELGAFVVEMRTYRDKFVAHLDALREMDIPMMEMAKAAVFYYQRYLLAHENGDRPLGPNLEFDMADLYAHAATEAAKMYATLSAETGD